MIRLVKPDAATEGRSAPRLFLQARSTVLWFYGSLAVAAMVLRIVLGDTAPAPLWYRDSMDYSGPILMTLALIPATYYSRSLVPAGACVLVVEAALARQSRSPRLSRCRCRRPCESPC